MQITRGEFLRRVNLLLDSRAGEFLEIYVEGLWQKMAVVLDGPTAPFEDAIARARQADAGGRHGGNGQVKRRARAAK